MGTPTNDFDIAGQPIRELEEYSLQFAATVRTLSLVKYQTSSIEKPLIIQFYRSGTSVAANIRESKYAESAKDLLHKLKIAEKELAECSYWIGLLTKSPALFSDDEIENVVRLGAIIKRILAKSITTIKSRLNK